MSGRKSLQLTLSLGDVVHTRPMRPCGPTSNRAAAAAPYRLRIVGPAREGNVDEMRKRQHSEHWAVPSRCDHRDLARLPNSRVVSGAMAGLDQCIETFSFAVVAPGGTADVLALARALLPLRAKLTPPELAVIRTLPSAHPVQVTTVRSLIRAGGDPLGDALCALRTPQQRRAIGAIFTPAGIVESMLAWAATQDSPARVVDAGAGSGRFIIAAGMTFPDAQLVAIDTDPEALLVLRANAEALGLSGRLRVVCADYRKFRLDRCRGSTLFIGNPPYLRHHAIAQNDKEWFAKAALRLGIRASKLAGLHVHFFLRTWQLAQAGDYGAFVTSAEWLDVKYGSVLRGMLVDGLGGTAVHVLAADAMPFEAITTGVVTTFHVGRSCEGLRMRTVASIGELGNLQDGIVVPIAMARTAHRWSILARGDKPHTVAAGQIQLGELFDVHRGQVTGANDIWIAGDHEHTLPRSVLFASITKAREIIEAGGILDRIAHLRRVIDLPADLESLDRSDLEAVRAFIRWAKSRGGDRPYVARHRKSWWSVGLKPPAPIICTYMAQRPPAFAYNPRGVRHINIAHGLYPRQPLDLLTLKALTRFLNANVRVGDGRTYAGGLTKFEPGEIERLYIPDLATLHGTA